MASGDAEKATPFGDQETSAPSDTSISNHESSSSSVSGHSDGLFGLPPEIRLIIWELLLPDRRILRAQIKGTSDQQSPDAQKPRLEFDDHPKQPVLSQICQESRAFILDRGNFIFKNVNDGGFWWSTEHDVFLVDWPCRLNLLSAALDGLNGLTMVRNIAVDSFQAAHLHFQAQCFVAHEEKASDNETDEDDIDEEDIDEEDTDEEDTDEEDVFEDSTELVFRHPARWLFFWNTVDNGTGVEHPIPRFFQQISRLTIHFTQPLHDHCDRGRSCDLLESKCSVTLDIPAKDSNTVNRIRDFISLWRDGEEESECYTYCKTWNWMVDLGDPFPGSIEFYRDSSFQDDGYQINYLWDYDWNHRSMSLHPQ